MVICPADIPCLRGARQQASAAACHSSQCPALWLQEVLQLGPTMYFGELALLRNEPRAATVRARTDVSVLSLSRSHFTAIVGQIQGELLQHADAYQPLSMPGKQVSGAALLSGTRRHRLPGCQSGSQLLFAADCKLTSNWPRLTAQFLALSRCRAGHAAYSTPIHAAQLLAGQHVQLNTV